MIRNFVLFVCLCLCINNVYAKDISYPVDTIALEEALKEIPSSKEDAKAELYLYFITNQNRDIPVSEIANKCIETIRDNVSCMNFIKTYNSYLDHANFCFKANNYGSDAFRLTFKQCASYANASYGYSTSEINSNEWGYCRRWFEMAENCSKYLEKYYTQKLSNSKLSASDKKYYECLLNKIQTGNMDIPTSKMENDCK